MWRSYAGEESPKKSGLSLMDLWYPSVDAAIEAIGQILLRLEARGHSENAQNVMDGCQAKRVNTP